MLLIQIADDFQKKMKIERELADMEVAYQSARHEIAWIKKIESLPAKYRDGFTVSTQDTFFKASYTIRAYRKLQGKLISLHHLNDASYQQFPLYAGVSLCVQHGDTLYGNEYHRILQRDDGTYITVYGSHLIAIEASMVYAIALD